MPDCIICMKPVIIGPKCRSCSQMGRKHTQEENEKNRQSQLGRKHSPETRRKMSLSMTGKKRIPYTYVFTELHRLHLSQSGKGKKRKRIKSITEEQRMKYVAAGKRQSPEKLAKISEATKLNWDNPDSELRRKVRAYWENEENRIRKSEISKRMWMNPEYRDKVTHLAMSNQHMKPNRQETTLNNILSDNFPNDWKFVGDGQLIIAGKCPDFVNVNGKKALIELFGDYWHKGENPDDRAKVFEPYGYSTLIIWEKELKTPNAVVENVRNTFYS